MNESSASGVLFRVAALLSMACMVTPWVMAQPKKEPAAVQPSKETAKKAGKSLEKDKGLANQTLTREQTDALYREGLAHESKGNNRAALGLFLEAGEAGHGLAQKKLAEIYDRGNSAAKRDYQSALHWYEKARAQGIEIPKPPAPIKGR